MADVDDAAVGPRRGIGGTLATYAELVRLPNLFTAPPDVVLGAAVAAGAGAAVSLPTVVGLALASVLLYAAGTTLNDYADAAQDARERPERPIPSGRVSRRGALLVGVALAGGGVALAFASGGQPSAAVALAVAALIGAYDGILKDSAAGFVAMGATRGTNVLLGVSAAGAVTTLPVWAAAVPVLVAGYVAAVTFMAESETGASDPRAVWVAVGGAVVAAVGALALLAVRSPDVLDATASVTALAAFVAWTGPPLRTAAADPTPGTVGPAVGKCVLGLVLLDAAFAGVVGGVGWALATATFLAPAVGLARVFDVT